MALLLGRGGDLVSGWLERRTVWQFAAFWGVCSFLAVVLAGAAGQWLIKRHLDVSFLLGYGLAFAVGSALPATLRHRSRKSRPANPGNGHSGR
jgi:CHASE2 domain-containing sensor protein